MDSIFALCSGSGKAGVAIFRISGPDSRRVLQDLTQKEHTKVTPRKLYYTKIYHPKTNNVVDEGMVAFFQEGASFTGEESLELYVHGSLAVIKLLNKLLAGLGYLRLAEPGEFTKRAFINGKFDLTAAEGLADLIDAETEMQHAQAIRQLGGGLEALYEDWRARLLKIVSLLEAFIDFPEEEIPEEVIKQAQELVGELISKIKHHLADNRRGERLRSGIKLSILGEPNVGKSSLLNLLMQREVAIVSDIAGTTRDLIEGHLDIGGYPVILQDTAGIREKTGDIIEQAGIERARKAQNEADIKLIIFDASKYTSTSKLHDFIDANSIVIFNKIDLVELDRLPKKIKGLEVLNLSLIDGYGLEILLQKIQELCKEVANPSESPQITRERHRTQLESALNSLQQFSLDQDLVLAAEDLRMTIRYLSNITGKITVEEILGEIFSSFCIGK